jgi:hypothetical protein
LKTSNPTPSKQVAWNFKKANWPEFSKEADNLVGDKNDNDSPYMLVTKLCDAMRISAKSAILRGKMHENKSFWTKELTNQIRTGLL